MSKRIDLIGKRFGALTALRPVPASETADHRPGWLVRCDCGREKIINSASLRNGLTLSCGQCVTHDQHMQTLSAVNGLYNGTAVEMLRRAVNNSEIHGVTAKHQQGGQTAWTAQIMLRRKNIYLGLYPTREEAFEARKKAEKKYYLPIIEEFDQRKGKKERTKNNEHES